MLGTVTRAGKALDLFTPEQPTWGATAISRELDIAKSQAHELLTSLNEIGLLRRVPGGRYRLGWRTLALGRNGLRCQFPDQALRVMRAFALRYREPVQLIGLDRDRLAVVASFRGGSATDGLLPSSLDRHLHACAPARCLLADLPPGEAADLLSGRELHAHTPRTPTTVAAVLDPLARAREDRFAVDAGETHPDLRGVAVPVLDADGHTLAALGIWTTAPRWAHLGPELTRATIGVGQRVRATLGEAAVAVAG